ncbi:hypothetical protein LY78DRAFT_657189 [Colletotrichum sublineola]|nr:hypothetical protein LY78DRAFT_657189 [Colletotrichum sublineola]
MWLGSNPDSGPGLLLASPPNLWQTRPPRISHVLPTLLLLSPLIKAIYNYRLRWISLTTTLLLMLTLITCDMIAYLSGGLLPALRLPRRPFSLLALRMDLVPAYTVRNPLPMRTSGR